MEDKDLKNEMEVLQKKLEELQAKFDTDQAPYRGNSGHAPESKKEIIQKMKEKYSNLV